ITKTDEIININNFFEEVPIAIKYLSLGLYRNKQLFIKLLEIIKSYKKTIFNNYFNQIYDLFAKIFIPALCLTDNNSNLLIEFWDVFSSFDYNTRYKLYNYWSTTIYGTHPILY